MQWEKQNKNNSIKPSLIAEIYATSKLKNNKHELNFQ